LASIIISLSNEFRSEYVASRDYTLNRLSKEHSPAVGILSHPEKAKKCVLRMGGLFNGIGKLVAFRIIDERIMISPVGPTVIHTWEAIKPYFYRQRKMSRPGYCRLLVLMRLNDGRM
jgi:hypothetical protein